MNRVSNTSARSLTVRPIRPRSIFRHRLFCLLMLLPSFGSASAQTVDWWDPAADSDALLLSAWRFPGINDVAATPWGVYAVGNAQCVDNATYFNVPDCKGLLVKYDADGDRLWRKLLKDRDDTWIVAVVADESGVYVHGTYRWNEQFPSDESFVRKYAHAGTLLWKFRDSEGNPDGYRIGRIRAQALVLHDGFLYATSRRNRGSILRKFSPDGELVWLTSARAVGSLAAGGGYIYGSQGNFRGRGHDSWFEVWDTDGNLVNAFLTETISENGLAWHDGALYYCAREGDYNHDFYSLNRMLPDGTLEWRVPYDRTRYDTQGCGVHVDNTGVTVAANLTVKRRDAYPTNFSIRRYDFDGAESYRRDYPSLVAVPNAVAVQDDRVYAGGYDLEAVDGFVGRFSGVPLLAPALAALVAGPAGTTERVAVLDHEYGAGPVAARVQEPGADSGTTVHFSEGLRPVDFFATGDLSGNGEDELVVLSRRPAVVEINDSATGEPHLVVPLDEDFEPVAAAIANDGASPVLAVLLRHMTKTYVRVDTFDATSGASLSTIPFNPGFAVLDVFALPSAGGLRYAVLQVDAGAASPGKLEIRNADGSLDRNLRLGKSMTPVRGLGYEESGAPRIAVLRQNLAEGWLDVAVVDPDAGVLAYLPFNAQFAPDGFEHSPDVDLNLSPQFTVAGREADAGQVKAETRDLASGAVLQNVFLMPHQPIEDLVYLPPGSGVATPSLALLVRDHFGVGNWSRFKVFQVDLLTGAKVDDWTFDLAAPPP